MPQGEKVCQMFWLFAEAGVRLLLLVAFVAQRIEHLTTDQKVGGSNPFERAEVKARIS